MPPRVEAGRIDDLLTRAREARVLVVGDLMLDRYISGDVDRVSPEAPVPVVRVESERTGLGGAGNVAANVIALGASCRVVGLVGCDPEGDLLLDVLARQGARSDGVLRRTGRPTTVKTRVAARNHQIVRFDREMDEEADDELADELAHAVHILAAESDVVVAQDYNKGVLAPRVIHAVLEAAKTHGIPSVVDPKRRNFFAYAGATVFKPNSRELGDALGAPILPDDAAWMEATRQRVGCDRLLVTLGDRGMAMVTGDGEHVRLSASAQAVYDVSGAGDTVTAAVAVALAVGASMVEAAVIANRAAAIEVAKAGVQTVTPSQIRDHLRMHGDA
jgi:D-glycero-beta-D-manno-heptose-7-phosphate kinase